MKKVVQVYNRYRQSGHGEDGVVDQTHRLLNARNVSTIRFEARSSDMANTVAGKLKAALATAYSPGARRKMAHLIETQRPDLIHAHNLYPLLTPSVLAAARRAGIPTVVTAHNYFLTCPVYTHLTTAERLCTACLGGAEYHCVTRNCRNNLAESLVYAARTSAARIFGLVVANTSTFIALSDFAKSLLVSAGYSPERIQVLPNAVPVPPPTQVSSRQGDYIAFAGRLTRSKGVDLLIDAARHTGLPVRLAGNVSAAEIPTDDVPGNVRFVGSLTAEQMAEFYAGARFLVFPSRWYEMCPMVVLEAMSYGRAVLASGIGSVPELVADGATGMLCEPGNSNDLARSMQQLWDTPDECARMGRAGRQRIEAEFNEVHYIDRLLSIYRRAGELGYPASE